MIGALPRVALQLWIVLFLVFFGAEVIHLEPGLRVLTQLLYGVALATWALLRLRGPADRLEWALLGSLLVYAVVAFLGRDRTESLGTLGLVTAYAAWFLLIRRLAQSELRGHVVLAVATGLAVTLAINAYLLIQEKATFIARFGTAPFEGVSTFPWESVNALPVLVLLAIPIGAWLKPGPVRTLLGSVIAISGAVVVPLSLGRAGWLGLGIVAALALTWWVGNRFGSLARLAMVAGGTAVLVIGVVIASGRLIGALGESGRLLLWEQGVNLFARSPLVGSGPGVYSWVRLEVPPANADLVAVRLLHHVPLQTLVDGGLLLLVGLAVAIGAWVLALVRRTGWPWPDLLALAALIGYAAGLLLDDFSYLPAVTAVSITVAGFLAPLPAPAPAGGKGWILPAALAGLALLSLPGVVGVDLARAAAQDGRAAMVDGRHSDAVAAFDAATRAHPESGAAWLGLGMARAHAGDAAGAEAAYQRATLVAPGDPRGYAAVATLRGDDAIELLRAATDRTFGDPQYAIRLGGALAEAGDVHAAAHAWAEAVAVRPALVRALPYEQAGVSAADVITEARIAIANDLHPAVVETRAALWDLGLAIGELPDDAAPAWRAVDAARRGALDEARSLADAAVTAALFEARGHYARAAVAAFACDDATEEAAFARARLSRGAFAEPAPEPSVRREFIYREASLGPTQPPGVPLGVVTEPWPWPFVDRPECP